MSPELDAAIEIAMAAHGGDHDAGGEPCIEHPLRVMTAVDGHDAKVVAILHDVIECTATDQDILVSGGITTHNIESVVALTHHLDETYSQHITRILGDPVATVVKIADITDNLSPQRLALINKTTRASCANQYRVALVRLQAAAVRHAEVLPAHSG